MFLGKYHCTFDTQSRLLLPSAFSRQISGDLYITQGFDRNLLFLTPGAFQEIYEKVKSLSISDPLARLLLRMILGTMFEAGTDDKGQIIIPDSLKNFAKLRKQVLLIGQGDYFEIWSPDLWKIQEVQLTDAEANASRFSMLTVSTR